MGTQSKPMGRLVQVDLRATWKGESTDFTPWLAQEGNIRLLGDAIGLELEVQSREQSVGQFWADIVCKDTASDAWVLIENQLERTDHNHLGQLLTYAAGLKAVNIVWIAQRFTDEHRAALDWLNEITEEQFNFFGIEIEAWRIGDSPVAPRFSVVCKPNDWAKTVREGAERSGSQLTATKQLQVEFWHGLRAHMEATGSRVRCQKGSPQAWMNHGIGRTGIHLTSIASVYSNDSGSYDTGEVRVELVFEDANAKDNCAKILARKQEWQSRIPLEVHTHSLSANKHARLFVRRDADITNRETWPELHAWLKTNLELFHDTFEPMVRELER
jgi:hypothetical protein